MNNLDSITNENNKKLNEEWPYILDYQFTILIIGDYGSGKTNLLLDLINEQDDIDKIYLYAKNLSEPNYKISIEKREYTRTKNLNDSNAFM